MTFVFFFFLGGVELNNLFDKNTKLYFFPKLVKVSRDPTPPDSQARRWLYIL